MVSCPAYRAGAHQARLRNTTGASTVLLGSDEVAANSDACSTNSIIHSRFTIAASQNLEIQHRCSDTQASNGFGAANSFGENEIYTIAEFWKLVE